MMETKYYIPTIEEAEEFVTYDYETHPMDDNEVTRFSKKQQPSYCNTPSENPETIKKQEQWFRISNREDMIVLNLEKEAFDAFYEKQKAEIEPYL